MTGNAAREVADELRRIRALAASDAPLAACRAVGQVAETAVKVTLTSSTHTKDEVTPSKPGQPPSLVTGKLRRSIHRTTPRLMEPGVTRCAVGSTLIYAPVHEFGPVTITARRAPYLKFQYGGSWHQVTRVKIPRRPYLATATERLIATGMLRQVAEDAWRSVIDL